MAVTYRLTFEPTPGSIGTLVEYKSTAGSVWIQPSSSPNPTTLNYYDLSLAEGASYNIRISSVTPECTNNYYRYYVISTPTTTTTTTTAALCPAIVDVDHTGKTTTTTTTLAPTTTTTTTPAPTTTTTTTTIAPTTTTTTTTAIPEYAACVDCSLTLTGTIEGQISELDAGVITASGCTVGEYVVDWYLNSTVGDPEFTSGSSGSTNPDISVFHPFTGEPAQGGTWYPVIRYIYLNGIKYTLTPQGGATRYSPSLLTCLDPIEVLSLNCGNGSSYTFNYGNYSHKISYVNTVNSPALASRSMRFDLDSSHDYIAWLFRGFDVADSVKFTYVTALGVETVLDYWKIGNDAGSSNVTVSPKIHDRQEFWKVQPLTAFTFSTGDYLRIDITPSSNTNTNWELWLKCLSAVDCDIWDSNIRVINPGSVGMTYDAANCRYKVHYTRTPWPPLSLGNILYRYSDITYYAGGLGNGYYDPFENDVEFYLRVSYASFTTIPYIWTSCNAQVGTSTVTKVSNVVTVTWSNITDYNTHKNALATSAAHPSMTAEYTSDDTLLGHYKAYALRFINAGSCGDTLTSYIFYTHFSNPPVFNDGTKTMTLTLDTSTKANNYIPLSACDFTGGYTQSLVNEINLSDTAYGDFSFTTSVRAHSMPIAPYYVYRAAVDDTAVPQAFQGGAYMYDQDLCDLTTKGWVTSLPAAENKFDFVFDLVTVTNSADPINNWRLERRINTTTGVQLLPGSYIKVYEIIGGVVTTGTINNP